MSDDRYAPLIPWYVNGTLPEEERRALEAHASSCEECRTLLETARDLASIRGIDPGALEDHPQAAHLERFALSPADLEPALRSWIQEHVGTCRACEDVGRIQRRLAGGADRTTLQPHAAVRDRSWSRAAAIFLAGALLAGTGSWWLASRGPAVQPPPASGWGIVELPVLSQALRGAPRPVVLVAEDQAAVAIGVSLELPEGMGPETMLRFAIGRGGAAVWSASAPASSVREDLHSTGLLTLVLPAGALPAGSYLMTITESPEGAGAPLLSAPFDVVRSEPQRQSPAATNPPQ